MTQEPLADPDFSQARPSGSLGEFARDVTSQFGEDGIIERILELLPSRTRWCVEFGAWDGYHFSNTYNLITNHRYSGVLIEGDPPRYRELRERYASNPQVSTLNALVGFGPADSLDAILESTPIPAEFDLLSVDIDGNDYHVWEATRLYRPRIVVIEYNPTIPNAVDFVQEKRPGVAHGSSLLALARLGQAKGYELVAVTFANAILVAAEYFGALGIRSHSIEILRPKELGVTHLFSGYDGRVFLEGCRRLLWHDLDFEEARVQQLPRWLQACPSHYGRLQRLLGRFYFPFRRRR